MHKLGLTALLASLPTMASASDPNTANQIIDAAYNHGEVVQTAAHLTDRIGGRLTNSPAMREAERWTQQQFRDWGLANVRAEGFEFGRGWWIESLQRAHDRAAADRPALHPGRLDAGDQRRDQRADRRRADERREALRRMARQARRQDRAGHASRRRRGRHRGALPAPDRRADPRSSTASRRPTTIPDSIEPRPQAPPVRAASSTPS